VYEIPTLTFVVQKSIKWLSVPFPKMKKVEVVILFHIVKKTFNHASFLKNKSCEMHFVQFLNREVPN